MTLSNFKSKLQYVLNPIELKDFKYVVYSILKKILLTKLLLKLIISSKHSNYFNIITL